MNVFHSKRAALLAMTGLLAMVGPVMAHPHIFIDAKARIEFAETGAVSAIHHSWTFDEAFSAWTIQGLDTNGDGATSPEEMQGLAAEHLSGLSQYHFYTYAGDDGGELDFAAGGQPSMRYEGGKVTLDFVLRPEPLRPLDGELELAVNDPEYYVAITFAGPEAVTLANAPQGCSVRLDPPSEMAPELADQLYALPPDVTELPPDLAAALRGVQGAIILSCGASPAAAQTAVEAVTEVAQQSAAPFGGPPPEPGFAMPRAGFLGWLAEQQKGFYASLTASLGALKTDNTAFMVLGLLSFLYGVFHAAGPGHGKVVIGSYVLANEEQARQGILLSFAAAMMQSLVAVGLVSVAAIAFRLTSAAMGEATRWIGIASYALIALLGLWLLARKLLAWNYARRHRKDMARIAHEHLHHAHGKEGHEHHDHHLHHHHILGPADLRGDWREQLGVVLSVGARPCSGALVVLVFALSQGVYPAGIAAVFLMGLGTALTTGVLAALAISAKGMAQRLADANGTNAGALVWWAELAGAFAVLAFGIVFLLSSI